MADDAKKIGEIGWVDLTIPDATKVKDFYRSVVGWESKDFKVGDHTDYVVKSQSTKETVAGICHAVGSNAEQPPYWLIYIAVKDVQAAADAAVRNGGAIVAGPKGSGASRICVIKDPAGAVFGVMQGSE